MTIAAMNDEDFAGRPNPDAELVEVLQSITRVLVGVALRSIEVPGEAVSLPQFRLLAVLADLGPTRSGRVARALDLEPSTITRLADRLVASGHVARQSDPLHRGVVTLTLTEQGTELVQQVARWRKEELGRIATRLAPEDRVIATRTLRRMVDAAGPGYGNVIVGLMPL
ncbi:MAG TPA: MarR family transcriptional regulator [Streptosporangiaceae bacterium]|jgi:DNA-binding MarR family transcriptional regulator|nr:MarR family transcriptional regulator [Streptosporangiaceae bacterium]